ncbi:hypothetical protein HRI_002140800 [Hibiscus trionum]|uniref:C2H2-type domain-containing protein n=1 Tax=Hibiscus trionum TaxID=183268 RepID=A0A9W7HZC7_HIBTR|nr:hypothetical protein HRI_002140800 [Hibiscus trionum]
MKRGRENDESLSLEYTIEMPKLKHLVVDGDDNVFECKTCRRRFSSFQALGGHRASHKKPKSTVDRMLTNDSKFLSLATQATKVHECGICGKKFGQGQALGGHMRKHRASVYEDLSGFHVVPKLPVLSRSNSKRILSLDLNLTPLENDLQALLGNIDIISK